MSDSTLTVPAEHREPFTLAAVKEVEHCGDWVESSAEDMAKYLTSNRTDKDPAADVLCAYKHLGMDIDVLNSVLAAPEGALEITAEPHTLAHIAETMADKVVGPMLAEVTLISPYDDKQAAKVRELTDSLAWAAGEAARFHAQRAADINGEAS